VLEQHTADKTEMDYTELAAMLADVEKLGYTFDYYLDAIPFNLTKMKTHTQQQRAASAKIKQYINTCNAMNKEANLTYHFRKGLFIIDNTCNLLTDNAKTLCEKATGLNFAHVNDSTCKLIEID
jgi:hypothetical protein